MGKAKSRKFYFFPADSYRVWTGKSMMLKILILLLRSAENWEF